MASLYIGGQKIKKLAIGSDVIYEDPKEEQVKSVTINSNGVQDVLPDSGKTLSKVTITTSVSGGGLTPGNAVWYWQNGQPAPVQVTGITWNSSQNIFEKTINNSPRDIVMVTVDGNPPAADLSNITLFYQCQSLTGSFVTWIACAFTDGVHAGPIYLTV